MSVLRGTVLMLALAGPAFPQEAPGPMVPEGEAVPAWAPPAVWALTGAGVEVLVRDPAPGRVAAGLDDGRVLLWPGSGEAPREIAAHLGPVTGVQLLEGGGLATAGDGDRVRMFQAGSGEPVWDRALGDRVTALAAQEGEPRLLAGTASGKVLELEAATGALRGEVASLSSGLEVLAPGPGGRLAMGCTDGRVLILEDGGADPVRLPAGHQGPVTALAFAGSGRLVSGGSDRSLLVQGLGARATGSRRLTGHRNGVTALAVLDGGRLASVSLDGTLRVWDLEAATQILVRGPSPGALTGLVRLEEDLLYAGTGGLVRRVRPTPAVRPLSPPRGGITGLTFGPGGVLAVASADHAVHLWEARAGRLRRRLASAGDLVTDVACGPRGRRLAVACNDGRILIHHLAREGPPRILEGHEGRVAAVTFAPAGGRMASAGRDGSVRLWDLASGSSRRLEGHEGPVKAVAFHPRGRLLASGSEDTTVRIWDAPSGRTVATLRGHPGHVHAVAFHPRGRLLASCALDGTVRIWDVVTGEPVSVLRGHAGNVEDLAWGAGGRLLMSAGADRTLRVWDPGSADCLRVLGEHPAPLGAVAAGPCGRIAAAGDQAGGVHLWDLARGRRIGGLPPRPGPPTALAAGEDLLAAGRADGSIRIWDTRALRLLRRLPGPPHGVRDLAFAGRRSSRLVAATADGSLDVWQVSTGERERRLGTGQEGPASAVAARPGGRMVAAGHQSGQVVLWDVLAGVVLETMDPAPELEGPVEALAWDASGRWLAGAGPGAACWLHDTRGGRLLRLDDGSGRGTAAAVAFQPGGGRLATSSRNGWVQLWMPESPARLLGARRLDTVAPVARLCWRGPRTLGVLGDGGLLRDLHGDALQPGALRQVHPGDAGAAASLPGGGVAVAGHDGRLLLWDAGDGFRAALIALAGTQWASLDAEGRLLRAEAGGNLVREGASAGFLDPPGGEGPPPELEVTALPEAVELADGGPATRVQLVLRNSGEVPALGLAVRAADMPPGLLVEPQRVIPRLEPGSTKEIPLHLSYIHSGPAGPAPLDTVLDLSVLACGRPVAQVGLPLSLHAAAPTVVRLEHGPARDEAPARYRLFLGNAGDLDPGGLTLTLTLHDAETGARLAGTSPVHRLYDLPPGLEYGPLVFEPPPDASLPDEVRPRITIRSPSWPPRRWVLEPPPPRSGGR